MKTRNFLTLLIALVPITVALPSAIAADAPAASPAKPAKAPVLKKGMTAEQIVAAIGQPEEKRPMKIPEGSTAKAETWIYRQPAGTRQVQVATGTRQVPAFVGNGMGEAAMGNTTEIIYGLKTVSMTRVTSLLMVNDQLELARQMIEQSDRYQ